MGQVTLLLTCAKQMFARSGVSQPFSGLMKAAVERPREPLIVQQESRNDDSDRNVTSFIAGLLQGRTDGSAWLQRFHVRQSKGFADALCETYRGPPKAPVVSAI